MREIFQAPRAANNSDRRTAGRPTRIGAFARIAADTGEPARGCGFERMTAR
jgi:hypothetical protein